MLKYFQLGDGRIVGVNMPAPKTARSRFTVLGEAACRLQGRIEQWQELTKGSDRWKQDVPPLGDITTSGLNLLMMPFETGDA
jgi:hypothetical protein